MESLRMKEGPWWRDAGLLHLNTALAVPIMTSVVTGYESSIVNGLQISEDWSRYFHEPRGKLLGTLQSVHAIGGICALPLTTLASDRLGRRGALFLGTLIMSIGIALQAVALEITTFILARFVVGFGLSFCQKASSQLVVELSYPTHRVRLTALYNFSWHLGTMLSAWICLMGLMVANGKQWAWRGPVLAQAALPIIQLTSIWFLPESPRWLVSKGLESRAISLLLKYHARESDERDPLVMFEMAQIRHTLRMEEDTNTTWTSLFIEPATRRPVCVILALAIFSQWSGSGLASYYINPVLAGAGIANSNTQAIINGCLQIFNLLAAVGATMISNVLGRRKIFLVSNSGMLIAMSIWTITAALYDGKGNTTAPATILSFFLLNLFYYLAYGPLLAAYALEILPSNVRANAVSITHLAMAVSTAFSQFVTPLALESISWRYYALYCGLLIAELAFVYFLVVETKGQTSEATTVCLEQRQENGDAHRGLDPTASTVLAGVASKTLSENSFDRLASGTNTVNFEHYEMIDRKSLPTESYSLRV